MSIRVLLADDHAMIREGLRALLERQDDIEVVAEADNGRAAVDLVQTYRPAVAVLDIGMPQLNGIDAAGQITRQSPGTRVIALSVHREKRLVMDMLRAGAKGYLLKSCASEELVQAVRQVHQGQSYLSTKIASTVLTDYLYRLDHPAEPEKSELSRREREVLQLLAEGYSSKQIAAELHVSVKTIVTHRQNIMNKLEIRSVAELTKFALREGLTSLEV